MKAVLLVIACMLIASVHAQGIRTVNGSLRLFTVNGATLTLASDVPSATPSESQLLSPADLTAAITNVVSMTQPQVR